jgi:hypothetical protein
MTPEEQAKALAEWLEQNSRSPPPEGVDEEVLQAIYVFRPDLAPPANVSVDDILAQIESGPFSPDIPLQASGGQRSTGPKDALGSRRHRRRFWSGAGALAAAAAVLIIALPQQEDAAQIGPQMQPQIAAEPPQAPLPPMQPESSGVLQEEAPAKAKREKAKKEEIGVKGELGSRGSGFGGGGLASEKKREGLTAAPNQDAVTSEAKALAEEVEDSILGALDMEENALNFGGSDEVGGIALGSASSTEIDFQGVGVSGELVKPQGALLLDRKRAPVSETIDEMDYAEDMDDAPSSGATSAPESESRRRLFQRKSRAAEAPPAPEASAAPPAPEESLEKNTTALASLAIPSDYEPPPDNLPSTNQWRIAEDARVALGQNRFTEAQLIAEAGLSLSAENTPALSMLHYVLGRCASQAGRESEANASFEKAIALNTARK